MSNSDDNNSISNAEETPKSTLPDLSKSKFTYVASMKEQRRGAACVAIDSNRFLMMGGYNYNYRDTLSLCEMYNRTSDQWTSLSCDLPKALNGCRAACVDGKVYLAGGLARGASTSNDVFVLDTSTTSNTTEWKWESVAPMNEKRDGCAVVAHKNLICVLGGINSDRSSLNTVEVYDTTTTTWSAGPSMSSKRRELAAVVVGNKLYAIGGYDGNNSWKTTEVLDLAAENPRWESGPDMNQARGGPAAVVILDRFVVVTGGRGENDEYLSTVEILDTTTNKWTMMPNNMQEARQYHGAVVLNQTDVYVAGGRLDTNNTCEKLSLYQLIPSPYGAGTLGPSLTNDSATGEDSLGIQDVARALAQVIALQGFLAPFALAIIGGWGLGKSFVMKQILESLKEYQTIGLTDGTRDDFLYCGHIYCVWFDSWTYAKGDLWASLMHQILVNLNDQLNVEKILGPELLMKGVSTIEIVQNFDTPGKQTYLEEFLKDDATGRIEKLTELPSKNSNITEALVKATTLDYKKKKDDLTDKETELKEAERELRKLKEEAESKSRNKNAWRAISDQHSDLEVRPAIKKLLDKCAKKYEKEFKDSEHPLPKTILECMDTVHTCERWREYLKAGQFSKAWVAVFLLSLLFAVLLPLLWKGFQVVYGLVAPSLVGIFGIYERIKSTATELAEKVQPIFREAINNANDIESALVDDGVKHEEDKLSKLKAEVSKLREGIWLMEGDSLDDVVKDRLSSGEYEDKLGVVHKAQLDLQHLTNAMLGNAIDESKKKDIFPRGDPRIVLFIDDLDRCSSEKVVEMLEAVQLLVKTKLFVVVMAIDSKYVTLSLENGSYKGILSPERHPSGLDYLEKIVQLTYRLSPPQFDEDLDRYLTSQMQPFDDDNIKQNAEETKKQASKTVETKHNILPGKTNTGDEDVEQNPEDVESAQNESLSAPNAEENSNDSSGMTQATPQEQETENKTASDSSDIKEKKTIPKKVVNFTSKDRDNLKHAFMIIDSTPRAQKRIVNALKILTLVWDNHPKDDTWEERKKAYIILLAFSASSVEGMRRGVCKFFFDVEKAKYREEVGKKNVLEIMDRSFGSLRLFNDPWNECRPRVEQDLRKLQWTNDDGWYKVKKELSLVRSFSFLGEHDETTNDVATRNEAPA